MRISSAFACSLASLCFACGPTAPSGAHAETAPISCATGGAAQFTQGCTVEVQQLGAVRLLIVRHSDGGFRRFAVNRENPGLTVMDGMQSERVTQQPDGTLEIAVGVDRYRFDARWLQSKQPADGKQSTP